jgi:parallel beta-helix repeat protein
MMRIATISLLILANQMLAADVTLNAYVSREAPVIRAGEVNELADGVYPSIKLTPEANGTAEKPTIIRAANRWKAVVRPGEYHGVVAGDSDTIKHVVIDGLEITGGQWDGVRFYHSENVTVRNCWIHDNQNIGILLPDDNGSLIERNLIEGNGAHAKQYGYGLYLNGLRITVRENTIRSNSNGGVQLWPAGTRCLIERNTIYDHKGAAIIVQRPTGASGLKPENANVIRGNHVWGCQRSLNIWRGFGEVVDANLLIGGEGVADYAVFVSSAKGPVNFTDNIIKGQVGGLTNYVKVLEK